MQRNGHVWKASNAIFLNAHSHTHTKHNVDFRWKLNPKEDIL